MFRFLLVILLTVGWTPTPQEQKKTEDQPSTSQPTSGPAARTKPRSPEQARILEELLRGAERSRPPIIRSQGPFGEDSPATDRAEDNGAGLLIDGTVVMDRLGELTVRGDRSEFRFKSLAATGDTPISMEINKNELLQAMEDEAATGVREFIISAEVTRYRGQNYLNIRKYRRQISHGNLGP